TPRPAVLTALLAGAGLIVSAWATRLALHSLGHGGAFEGFAPDAVALVGSLVMALAGTGLARGSGMPSRSFADVVVDAGLVGVATFTCVWAFVVAPAGAVPAASVLTRVVQAGAPALDAYLVAVVVLGLGRASGRTAVGQLIAVACASLAIGDVLYLV